MLDGSSREVNMTSILADRTRESQETGVPKPILAPVRPCHENTWEDSSRMAQRLTKVLIKKKQTTGSLSIHIWLGQTRPAKTGLHSEEKSDNHPQRLAGNGRSCSQQDCLEKYQPDYVCKQSHEKGICHKM